VRFEDLIAGEPGVTLQGGGGVRITDIAEDSRRVSPGALFIARPGVSGHGGRFVEDALARGAVAVLTDLDTPVPESVPRARVGDVVGAGTRLAERFFGSPSRRLRLTAVTGTNGKTTTAHLIQQIATLTGARCGLIGTVHIDDGARRRPADLTTPGAVQISRSLARMAENGCAACAIEASSHAIAQRRIEALALDAAVFTNLSGDHLDYHGDMEAYADAKAALFAALAPDATAIVNTDSDRADRMIRDTRARVMRCSAARSDAEVSVTAGDASADGARVTVRGPWGAVSGRFLLAGGHNLMNLAQALAAAHALGAPVGALDGRLDELVAPPGRLERVRGPGGPPEPVVLVDYAHTDDALANALRAVRPMVAPGGRLWVVFGCGGDRDAHKRPRMGAVAATLADRVIVTSDNPRTEDPGSIIEAVLRGVPADAPARTESDPDRAGAIHRAVAASAPGDVVLIAGKGHEDYQIVPDGAGGSIRRHFDDREVAREALARRAAASAA